MSPGSERSQEDRPDDGLHHPAALLSDDAFFKVHKAILLAH